MRSEPAISIARQLFTESLLLSALGAVCGLTSRESYRAVAGTHGLRRGETLGLVPTLDWHVLVFTGLIAVLTTALVGLAPALRAGRADVNATLRDGTRSATASAGRLRLGKIFVATQVALSLVLLVTAGLFLRTLTNLQHADLGYAREKLLLLRVDGVTAGYRDQRLETAYRQLLDAFRNTPGVRGATYRKTACSLAASRATQCALRATRPGAETIVPPASTQSGLAIFQHWAFRCFSGVKSTREIEPAVWLFASSTKRSPGYSLPAAIRSANISLNNTAISKRHTR